MIQIFSCYGERWGEIELSDLQLESISSFKVLTDGTYVVLQRSPEGSIFESIGYATSGGLHLGFAALIVSDASPIKFVIRSLADEKVEIDKTV